MSFRMLRMWRLSRWRKLRKVLSKATPQVKRPALIGAGVIGIILLLAFLGVANTNDPFQMPSSLGKRAVSYAVWGMKPSNLLMALPIGAFLVVLARSFVGMKAFGLFTPMLIAIAFLQIGPIFGPVVLISAVGVGMIAAPALLKLRMTRVGFLGVLISFVVFVLAGLQVLLDTELQVDAFPVVVTALVVERWHRQWEKDGAKEAANIAFQTLILALLIQFVMVSHVALTLIEISPLVLPGFAGLAIALLGRYRGLRMSEIKRFAPIWLEGRRNGKLLTSLDERDEIARENDEHPEAIIPKVDIPVLPRPAFGNGWNIKTQTAFARLALGAAGRGFGRDPGNQPAQFDHREIQSALGNRGSARQGGGESGAERWRGRNYRNDMRHLQLWGSA
ncbi:7TM domain-containing protein [Erythrobacter alti]|uniref:7TM domain-containing protein n=1 Tax=Erythrobacter alti TaxID=1896145 RepID=UPI0030F3FF4E